MTAGHASLESRLRRLAADRLGVDPTALAPGVSLVDDLAADSLDLAEIPIAIDEDMGVLLERSALDRVPPVWRGGASS